MNVPDRRISVLLVFLVASFLFLYRDVILKLIHDWSIDENYSHGFLVIPVALYLSWERRDRFAALPRNPSFLGLIIAIGGMGMLLGGVLGAEVFTTEVSMLATIAGTLLFLFGWAHLRVMLFPIAFLMLMIPSFVKSIPFLPLRVGITQSNMSMPSAMLSKILSGIPTPMR